MRTRIKICGITRPQDAATAAAAGADAVGIVFHPPSPRCVTMATARKILAALPAFVSPVGLFVNANLATLRQTAGELHLRHIQLHGDESPDDVANLRDFVILKAIRVDRATFLNDLAHWRQAIATHSLTNLHALILETPSSAPGGTGLVNDWDFIRQCQTQGAFANLPPLIAAGGLTPENVGAVVREIHPFAVDVSSGVESSKGIKSPEKIEAFVRAVSE